MSHSSQNFKFCWPLSFLSEKCLKVNWIFFLFDIQKNISINVNMSLVYLWVSPSYDQLHSSEIPLIIISLMIECKKKSILMNAHRSLSDFFWLFGSGIVTMIYCWFFDDLSKSAPLSGTDNPGLFILREYWCSIIFLSVIVLMVVSKRVTAMAPTSRQRNDYGSQPKTLSKTARLQRNSFPNMEDQRTVLSLTSNHWPFWYEKLCKVWRKFHRV